MILDNYDTDELRHMAARLRSLERVSPFTTMSMSEICGHPRLGGYPACWKCIEKEIERREHNEN